MSHTPHSRPAGPAPDAASLQEAALDYLARYAATEAGLRRVLERRIDRWALKAAAENDRDSIAGSVEVAKRAVPEIVARLVAAGAVSDTAFAASRARNLVRAGRSHRAVVAHLAAKGVGTDTARAALPDDADSELAAALALARRRRIGPFRAGGAPDASGRQRELAVLARAGFPQDVARQALTLDPNEAEEMVLRLRR
jgi:regulatory protein